MRALTCACTKAVAAVSVRISNKGSHKGTIDLWVGGCLEVHSAISHMGVAITQNNLDSSSPYYHMSTFSKRSFNPQ